MKTKALKTQTKETFTSMDEIFSFTNESTQIRVRTEDVLEFLFQNSASNNQSKNSSFNTIRKKYISAISDVYHKRDTKSYIIFSKDDIEKILMKSKYAD